MLKSQDFRGVYVVGIAASLRRGVDALFAQCAWFDDDEIDWVWVEVSDIQRIELREDERFRGGASCIWIVTEFAEYAVMTAHVEYDEPLEIIRTWFNAPRVDVWPRRGIRPEWWPVDFANAWPYDRAVREHYADIMAKDPLALATQNLSIDASGSRTGWLRLGPKGDSQLPGRPAHHLSHLTEWVLAPDAGLRKTAPDLPSGEEGKGAGPSEREAEEGEQREQGTAGGDRKAQGAGGGRGTKRKGLRPDRERANKRRAQK
ncbi:hypothetical protein FRC12_005547 [Ceratobasidium sp. 428]|nr:hypothetical protein FRC09_000704 [Ceratobasidium sp. 395]KAG8768461.1 hypothetical protein FRC12_005547 [Ceratobasidium sp. 428]